MDGNPPHQPASGEGESFENLDVNNALNLDINYMNKKRTYDAYQDLDLVKARHAEEIAHVKAMNAETLAHQKALDAQTLAHQQALDAQTTKQIALIHSNERIDMVARRAMDAHDVATDNLWNPVQQGAGDTLTARAVSLDDASLKAIGAAVATAFAQSVSAK